MARCLARDILFDRAGNAVTNALGYLYLQGTTTAVSDAYNASSGGSLVTTVTTDSLGGWEVWFTSPKYFDIKWTDNSNAAYPAADSSVLLDFADVTETHRADPASAQIGYAVAATDNVQWCGGINAADTNDGLSIGRGKQTLLAAYDALPSGGGIIYVLPGATMGGAVSGQGMWLTADTAGKPAGWRLLKPVVVEGVGGLHKGINPAFENDYKVRITNAGSASVTQPFVHIDQSSTPFVMRNIECDGWLQGFWFGMKSDMTEWADADNKGVIGIRLENCSANLPNSGASTGVWALRLGGSDTAQSFMCKFIKCNFMGRAVINSVQQTVTDANAYAAYVTNAAFVYFEECGSQRGGGLWYEVRSTEPAQLYVRDWFMENDSGFEGTPVVKVVGGTSVTSRVHIVDCDSADSGATLVPAGVVDLTTSTLPVECVKVEGGLRTGGTTAYQKRAVAGIATVDGVYSNASTSLHSLAEDGQVGFDKSRIVARHDAANRAAPAVARYANRASQILTSGWTASGTGTTTTGQADPFGGTAAVLLTPTANGNYDYTYDALTAATLAVGDSVVWGGWVAGTSATSGLNSGGNFLVSTAGMTGVTWSASLTKTRRNAGRGEWQFVAAHAKVTSAGSDSTGDVRLNLRATQSSGTAYPARFSHPVLLYVPASASLSDAEVAEIALNLGTVPSGLAAGEWGTLPAQPFHAQSDVEIDGALNHDGTTVGFYGTTPTTKPAISGSRGGNAALANLLTALALQGLITDSTTA